MPPPTASNPAKRLTPVDARIIAGIFVIALSTVIAYWPAITSDFIWDDDAYVTKNTALREVDGLLRIWIPRQTPQYYPAVFTMFWIEYHLWGIHPLGYHVVNVLLHVANALLVWRLCVRLKIPGGWLIGAVFALHPVHVESVAWISERKNVLSALFYLTSVLMYLKFDDARERHEGASVVWRPYAISLVLFVLALLSKTVTCSLPAALILMMLWQRKRLSISRLAPLTPFFVIGLILALNTAAIEREHVGADGPAFAFSLADRMLIASKALLFYPWKLLAPWPLMFVYPRWIIDDHNLVSYWSVAVVGLIGLASLELYRRGRRGVPLALAYFAGTIFPALGFFNVYPMLFSFVADHFQYLASLGIIVLMIGGCAHVLRSERRMRFAAVVILTPLTILTWLQAHTYKTAEAVWRDTLVKNPEAWMPHNNLGTVLIHEASSALDVSDAEAARLLLDEAIVHVQKATAAKPDHRPAQSNLSEALRLMGRCHEIMGDQERAHASWRAALDPARMSVQLTPQIAESHWQLARIYHLLQRFDEAIASYTQAIRCDPDFTDGHSDLARLLVQLGRMDEADSHFQVVLKTRPDDVNALAFLGEKSERAGRCAEAGDIYRRALSATHTDDAYVHVGYKLVRLLTTCPDRSYRDGAAAVIIAERICQIARRNSPYPLGMLASAYAQSGRFNDAVQTAQEAIQVAQRQNLPDVAQAINQQLQAYRSGTAP